MNKSRILIVDDESGIRSQIAGLLEDEGYETLEAKNSTEAYACLSEKAPDIILLDIWLQESTDDGLVILDRVVREYPNIPVIMISGHGTIETAVMAIRAGAYDFIEKPFEAERLLLMISRASDAASLRKENYALRLKSQGPTNLIGQSAAMLSVRQTIERVATGDSRVLIAGAAGTGKEVAARLIHRLSRWAEHPFIILNASDLTVETLQDKLVGTNEKPVIGSIVLDEVADMSLDVQNALVQILQKQLSGQTEPSDVQSRIIAITSRNLHDEMAAGKFRQDLYYRLSVVPIHIPSLAERRDDIPLIANHFMNQISREQASQPRALSEQASALLQAYEWPGNIRQLKNIMEQILIMTDSDLVQAEDIPSEIIRSVRSDSHISNDGDSEKINWLSMSLREARESFEKKYLSSQIKRFGGNVSKTADFVGMERSALHRKLKALGIQTISGQDSAKDRQGCAEEELSHATQ